MAGTGLTGDNPAAPPYSVGPYTWDQLINFKKIALSATELTASGAINSQDSFITLNNDSGAIAATIAAPAAGRILVISQIDTGTAGHTVTLTAGTYDGTLTVATFNAESETLVLFGISATRFVIVENIGAVALS